MGNCLRKIDKIWGYEINYPIALLEAYIKANVMSIATIVCSFGLLFVPKIFCAFNSSDF